MSRAIVNCEMVEKSNGVRIVMRRIAGILQNGHQRMRKPNSKMIVARAVLKGI
jgi:hypothetical protein